MQNRLVNFVNERWRHMLLPIGAVASLCFFSSAEALIVGIVFALFLSNPWAAQLKTITPKLLAIALIGLGFNMDLRRVLVVGFSGLHYTLVSLLLTFLLSALIGKLL